MSGISRPFHGSLLPTRHGSVSGMRRTGLLALATGMLVLSACAGAAPEAAPTSSSTPAPSHDVLVHTVADAPDEALRDELLQLLEEDQAERLEGADFGGD